jgi:TonB family protein
MKRLPLLGAVAMAALSGLAHGQAPPPGTPEEKLSHEQIKKTVDAHVGDLKDCMKENGGKAEGKLVVRFGVLPNGHTGDVKIIENSSNAGLDKCIAKAFGRWVFPQRKAGPFQGVDYPFTFSAPKPPPPAVVSPEEMKGVEGVINSHMPEVRKCYEDALMKKDDLKGEVDIEMVIAPAGTVSGTKIVNTTVKFPMVENCINGLIPKWVFAKRTNPGNLTITYPFVLKGLEKKE